MCQLEVFYMIIVVYLIIPMDIVAIMVVKINLNVYQNGKRPREIVFTLFLGNGKNNLVATKMLLIRFQQENLISQQPMKHIILHCYQLPKGHNKTMRLKELLTALGLAPGCRQGSPIHPIE